MSKSTAAIPKSRSKYLIQFLKRKVEGSLDDPNNKTKDSVSIYSHTSDLIHRRGNSTQMMPQMREEPNYQHPKNWREEDKESIYQTPKNYANNRNKRARVHLNNYDDSDIQLDLESTNYTREGPHFMKSKFQRRTEGMKLNTSLERVKQVNGSDQSIEEIEDEEDETISTPFQR